MSNTTLAAALLNELSNLLAPLSAAGRYDGARSALLQAVGCGPDLTSRSDLRAAIGQLAVTAAELADLDASSLGSWDGAARVLEIGRAVQEGLRDFDRAVTDPALASQAAGLGADLAGLLVGLHLRANHTRLFRAACLLTLIDPRELTAAVIGERQPWIADALHFDRAGDLIREPWKTLRQAYLVDDLAGAVAAHRAAARLFPLLGAVAEALGLIWFTDRESLDPPPPAAADSGEFESPDADVPGTGTPDDSGATPPPAPPVDLEPFLRRQLPRFFCALPQLDEQGAMAGARLGLAVVVSSAQHPSGLAGVIVMPCGSFNWSESRGGWQVAIASSGQIPAFVIGPGGITLAPSTTPLTDAEGEFSVERLHAAGEPAFLLGSADGSRLELGAVRFGVGFKLQPAAERSVALTVAASSGKLVIAPGDGDGFLQRVLPADGVAADFDLGLVLSSARGLELKGGAGLETTLPARISLGPLGQVESLHIAAGAAGGGLHGEASCTLALRLGPVAVTVDRIGIAAALSLPESGGNFGPVNLEIGFKGPSGAGLSIDAAGLVGGGFLAHDEAAGQYAGVLQLEFEMYQLQAFGILSTRLPTGPGYSLVAMIDAEFPPIQLGFGFTLNGVGGLLGIHRTASVEALRAALKAHTLSNLLFPKDPIANAPQLLSELGAVFPAAEGRYVFGPLARIGWGTPTVLTLDLALILELPSPIRLVLLGALAVLLPSPEEKLVELHMDVLGTIDFGKSEGALDAALHDSRLLRFLLHGSMALRVCWAGNKTFLLAVGGFHPKFQPPPGFPALERVGISMPSGSISKLNLNGYLALTSNTLQIGAHLDIFVGVDGFGVSGYLNFDTLIQIRPFHFDADISGGVALTFEGEDVMSLRLDASLSGPTPWHVAGKFSFDVLFWSVSKSFSVTFGDPATAQPLDRVDVGLALREALADPRNFNASLAAQESALVTLKQLASAADVVLAHPAAALSVHQRVVPLGLTISRFGAAAPLSEALFQIDGVTADGAAQASAAVLDDFAPAQFLALSDDEELSSPSFERLAAGVEIAGGALAFGYAAAPAAAMTRAISYETFLIDTPDGPMRPDAEPVMTFPVHLLMRVLDAGAAGRATLGGSGRRRYAGPARPVVLGEVAYVVATSDQLAASDVGSPTGVSYSVARAALAAELAEHPERRGSLQVVARYEVS